MEVHFSQRLILGEWSWSLHRATENDATVAVYKSQKPDQKKQRNSKKHSASERHGKDRGDKMGAASSAADVFPHLRQKRLVWGGFLRIPAFLLNSGWRFITAQQFGWWLRGGEGKPKDEGKEVEKQ